MKTTVVSILAASAVSMLVLGTTVMAQQPKAPGESPRGGDTKDAQTACTEMMQGSGTTEEGRKAMREFMQSAKAPQAMSNMMHMAWRMGNGDPMLGMTKMMEMMGGQGGMMGSSSGAMGDGGMMGGARGSK